MGSVLCRMATTLCKHEACCRSQWCWWRQLLSSLAYRMLCGHSCHKRPVETLQKHLPAPISGGPLELLHLLLILSCCLLLLLLQACNLPLRCIGLSLCACQLR